MKKCPFCAEEIQDEAIKCKHCKEWLNKQTNDVDYHNHKSEEIPWSERILCEDEGCVGILNHDGVCGVCGRTPDEVRSGVKNKHPKHLYLNLDSTTQDIFSSHQSKWINCPKCRGKAFGGRGCLLIGLICITFPIGLLFLLIKPTYTCQNCGYRFKV